MTETLPSAAFRLPRDRVSRVVRRVEGRVAAVLGPTNTGKTHYAVERLVGHSSGTIGLPLRLLAREIYDKVVALKGATRVALITGEEKITPPNAAYFVCTVESMPVDKDVAFVAVDEIQLAEDPERGHIFTHRLLNARGRDETLFLGSDSMRSLIRRLTPEAEIITRPRFSQLRFTGPKKISRLPRRSAIVAFSAAEVYALAEVVRRQKGGAAVVMGALSPRTRNAQVALYEAGDVDYLVATDAIGMGLNMSINHVVFASLTKFDGRMHRALTTAEIAQIAGRAGRHMNNGTFGIAAGMDDQGAILTSEMVERIESHSFETVRKLEWRNGELDYTSPSALIRSLEAKPPLSFLAQTREAEDLSVLRTLSRDESLVRLAAGPAAVALFWQVCQIPDFRKTMADIHAGLVAEVYRHLMTNDGVLPRAWIARQVDRLDNTQGDIDTLATRLAHIRTWTYVANHSGWVDDPLHWQDRTREVEDRLSDALHERLSQRFIDRRTSVLMRQKRESDDVIALVGEDGEVTVEGHFMGTLNGFRFEPDAEARGAESRALMNAANRALASEIKRRVNRLAAAPDKDIVLRFENADAVLVWNGRPIGQLVAGKDVLSPRVGLARNMLLEGSLRQTVQSRLDDWLKAHIHAALGPLVRLSEAVEATSRSSGRRGRPLQGPARGLAFTLVQALGNLPRSMASDALKPLEKSDRAALRRLGVTFGETSIYMPTLLKPAAARLKLMLAAIHRGTKALPLLPKSGAVALDVETSAEPWFYEAAGYRVIGKRAIRIDMLERLASALRAANEAGPFEASNDFAGLVGGGGPGFAVILTALGFTATTTESAVWYSRLAKRPSPRRHVRKPPPASEHSPFAALAGLKRQAQR